MEEGGREHWYHWQLRSWKIEFYQRDTGVSILVCCNAKSRREIKWYYFRTAPYYIMHSILE